MVAAEILKLIEPGLGMSDIPISTAISLKRIADSLERMASDKPDKPIRDDLYPRTLKILRAVNGKWGKLRGNDYGMTGSTFSSWLRKKPPMIEKMELIANSNDHLLHIND